MARMTTAPLPHQPIRPSDALRAWLHRTLASQGWDAAAIAAARLQPLQTEASFRQFYRVQHDNRSLVLMDSPPAKERNTEFVSIAGALAAANITVPEVLAHNEPAGWLLLSDLGQVHFIDRYQAGDHLGCLRSALITLERLAAVRHPTIEPYSLERLSDELDIFTTWLVRSACKLNLPDRLFQPVRELLLQNADNQKAVCVHRDFHCKNLLLTAPKESAAHDNPQTGVLDFQDALIGPNGYDLASLLHDCYWQFDDHLIDSMIDKVAGVSRRSVDLLAVQRQLKAIGIFARLAQRDNKTSHLLHIEPVVTNLTRLCARYAELAELGEWLQGTLQSPARLWVAKQ